MYELNESKVKSDVSDDESRSYPAFKFAVLFFIHMQDYNIGARKGMRECKVESEFLSFFITM